MWQMEPRVVSWGDHEVIEGTLQLQETTSVSSIGGDVKKESLTLPQWQLAV